jgi:tricorn protease
MRWAFVTFTLSTMVFAHTAFAELSQPQASVTQAQTGKQGYYRFPAIYNRTVVFTAEGDLWTVSIEGGIAHRLTSHPGEETRAAFSPDGETLAFMAEYEGPKEIYTMPATGGLPERRTFDGNSHIGDFVSWMSDGKILYAARRYAVKPGVQLATIDFQKRVEVVPLSQAAQGSYDQQRKNLYFTRLRFQGSRTKRYKGGTVENIWKYSAGQEAMPLTADYDGTSKNPIWWNGRIYFLSDRDGTMNLWSMDENGKNLKQHTKHQGWDMQDAALGQGRIVYQIGADLGLYEISSGADHTIPIELASDFDHLREHWINSPMEYLTSAHLSPDGSRVVLTSRGHVFVAPVENRRFIEIGERNPGRYRDARFLPDGKTLLILSSESGEVEFWRAPAEATGAAEKLTSDGKILRWQGIPSPDGKWIAHQDKNDQLWLLGTATKVQKLIATGDAADNSKPPFGCPLVAR